MTTSLEIAFPGGLPGFDNEHHFLLMEDPRLAPLVFMQSRDTAELCFLILPVNQLVDRYELALTDADAESLGLDANAPAAELITLAIVTIPEKGPATANLLAPIVINPETKRAVQAVRADQRYSHQHAITPPCANDEVAVCS
jgi:flagellar assembly factor FliW